MSSWGSSDHTCLGEVGQAADKDVTAHSNQQNCKSYAHSSRKKAIMSAYRQSSTMPGYAKFLCVVYAL